MSDAPHFDPEMQEPKPPRKSSGLKWVLIILAGLCGVCCCGVAGLGIYGYSQTGMSFSAETGRTRTTEITEIEMPAGYEPKFSMAIPNAVKMVFWMAGDGKGMVVLAEAQGNVSQEELRQSVNQQMQQQGQKNNITIEEKTEKAYTIRGQECTFEIAKGTMSDGNKVWQVVGSFPSKSSSAFVMMILPQDTFDEAAVDQLIQSIK